MLLEKVEHRAVAGEHLVEIGAPLIRRIEQGLEPLAGPRVFGVLEEGGDVAATGDVLQLDVVAEQAADGEALTDGEERVGCPGVAV